MKEHAVVYKYYKWAFAEICRKDSFKASLVQFPNGYDKGTKSNEIVRAYYEREFATLSKRFADKIISDGNGNAYYLYKFTKSVATLKISVFNFLGLITLTLLPNFIISLIKLLLKGNLAVALIFPPEVT